MVMWASEIKGSTARVIDQDRSVCVFFFQALDNIVIWASEIMRTRSFLSDCCIILDSERERERGVK